MKKKHPMSGLSIPDHPEYGQVEQIYFKDIARSSFTVIAEDENGKKIRAVDANSRPILLQGKPMYECEEYDFTNIQSSAKNGSWCEFYIYENTPEKIKKELKRQHKTGGVLTYEQKLERENPGKYKEVMKLKKEKDRNKSLSEANKDLAAKVKALEEKLKTKK